MKWVAPLIKLEETVTLSMLALIVICVFAAAIMRTIGYPIIWSVDIAQLLFVWVCMLGGNQALRKGEHVGVDYFVQRLSTRAQMVLDAILHLLILAFLAALVYFGFKLTVLNPQRDLGTIAVPYAWVTAAIPVGGLLMLLTNATQTFYLFSVISGRTEPDFNLPFMQKFHSSDGLDPAQTDETL